MVGSIETGLRISWGLQLTNSHLEDMVGSLMYLTQCDHAVSKIQEEVHRIVQPVSWEVRLNTMAEQNVPAQPPTRTDEQIVPRSQWLTIGKSNLLFNAQKIQKNPIFQISVDILKNTNFFQALTASANVPAIYLQQFWKTMSYNDKTGVYSCQLDEQWFDLSADLLRKALAITPVNPAHPFELPPSGDTVLDFVNELGYPEPVELVSKFVCIYDFRDIYIGAMYGFTVSLAHVRSEYLSRWNPPKTNSIENFTHGFPPKIRSSESFSYHSGRLLGENLCLSRSAYRL
ncbi:hypothetical protein Tco_0108871 [Tanacetum coccineum]